MLNFIHCLSVFVSVLPQFLFLLLLCLSICLSPLSVCVSSVSPCIFLTFSSYKQLISMDLNYEYIVDFAHAQLQIPANEHYR